jgi:hypothetical protein
MTFGERKIRIYSAIMTALALFGLVGCGGNRPAQHGRSVYDEVTVDVGSSRVSLRLAKPVSPHLPPFLVVFASGDGGLDGISLALLKHLGDQGNWVVGFSSEEAFQNAVADSSGTSNYIAAREALSSIIVQGKRALQMPDGTPVIVTGMSRGANVVIASAGDPALAPGIMGAVAIALTREFDNLTIPEAAKHRPGVKVDDQGRIQTYPALERLGSIPLAIIQSTNDSYVRSAESRRLLGPDTPTRRLYEVESSDHSFQGGEAALMRDLDDAMRWIGSFPRR